MYYTYHDYLQGNVSHHDYHAQFIKPFMERLLLNEISIQELEASTDIHFNDIALNRWDNVANILKTSPSVCNSVYKASGYGPSLSTCVCILKVLARQLLIQSHQ